MSSRLSSAAKIATVLFGAIALTACAKTNADQVGSFNTLNRPGSPQDFAANVGDRVFFESDQTDLTPTAQATLDKQAKWLSQYAGYSFTVEGHADERGTREYNFALGEKRAQTVKDYLAARGIAAARIRTISYGKERPVATCDDISCWSQNRRAVTVLKGNQS